MLVAVALLVYWVEAAAWPLAKGRDMWDYLAYYVSLPDSRPVYSDLMLFRTPVTPLVLGVPLSLGGVAALEVVFGVLYAVTILAWAAAGLQFGRLTALVVAVVMLAYPGLATLYHQASSDAVFATGFALWALGVAVVLRRPSWRGFAWLGGGVAVLVLTRPASQVLVLGVVLPFLVPLGWRARGVSMAAFLAAAMLPLACGRGSTPPATTTSRSHEEGTRGAVLPGLPRRSRDRPRERRGLATPGGGNRAQRADAARVSRARRRPRDVPQGARTSRPSAS